MDIATAGFFGSITKQRMKPFVLCSARPLYGPEEDRAVPWLISPLALQRCLQEVWGVHFWRLQGKSQQLSQQGWVHQCLLWLRYFFFNLCYVANIWKMVHPGPYWFRLSTAFTIMSVGQRVFDTAYRACHCQTRTNSLPGSFHFVCGCLTL